MKNFSRSVSVIGGGVAGLSAAVFLADKGFKVQIFEASPKLGGRAWSFFDKTFGDTIDNGQHILASWYHNSFDFLKLIGSYDKLSFQKQLEVRFADDNANQYRLKASKLPPPLHLVSGLMTYKAIGFKDRRLIGSLVNDIKNDKISEPELKNINTDELFRITRQTEKGINNFWKPFIIAVFNAEPENTSAYLFSKIIKTGFIEKGGSNLVLPGEFLNEIFSEPAVKFLNEKNCSIYTNKRVAKFCFEGNAVTSIILEDSTEVKSDFYISSVPFFDFKNMVNGEFTNMGELKASPIVNIHLKFEKAIDTVIQHKFIGLLNTHSQWVFRVKNDQVCIVISAANEIAEMDKTEILQIAKDELIKCIPELRSYKVTGERVLKEMRATFVPDKDSLKNRPENATKYRNFFIAGDWTDTELPATIESAVLSSKKCVDKILAQLK
jgi:hydroxysqualene dehydroxylase